MRDRLNTVRKSKVPGPLIDHWIRPEIRTLSHYHVPDATGMIKLDAMENPYSLPDSLVDEWLERLRELELNRYPDAGAEILKEKLSGYLGLSPDQEILLGNGSDELIQIIAMALSGPDRVLMAPEPGFVMYRLIARSLGLRYVGVPLVQDDFHLDQTAMLKAIEENNPAVIFLAYPNNPTGNLFDRQVIESIIDATNGLVVIDEAYHSFALDSWIGDLGRFDNLLVMRTLSKIGLAGLRIGMLAGAKSWLDELNKIRLPYNINALSQASAVFLLEHGEVFEQQAAQIRADREQMYARLESIPQIEVWPSRANFLLIRSRLSQVILKRLKKNNILIKNLHGSHEMLAQCLRITIGTTEENQAVLDTMKELI